MARVRTKKADPAPAKAEPKKAPGISDDTVEFIRQRYVEDGFGMQRIVRALEEANIKPVRGKQWYAPVVLNVVRRHGWKKGTHVPPEKPADAA